MKSSISVLEAMEQTDHCYGGAIESQSTECQAELRKPASTASMLAEHSSGTLRLTTYNFKDFET
jgi:hypothetical protein